MILKLILRVKVADPYIDVFKVDNPDTSVYLKLMTHTRMYLYFPGHLAHSDRPIADQGATRVAGKKRISQKAK